MKLAALQEKRTRNHSVSCIYHHKKKQLHLINMLIMCQSLKSQDKWTAFYLIDIRPHYKSCSTQFINIITKLYRFDVCKQAMINKYLKVCSSTRHIKKYVINSMKSFYTMSQSSKTIATSLLTTNFSQCYKLIYYANLKIT